MEKGISRAIHRKGKMLYRFYCRTALTRLLRSRLLAHRITSARRGNSLAVGSKRHGEAAPTEPGSTSTRPSSISTAARGLQWWMCRMRLRRRP